MATTKSTKKTAKATGFSAKPQPTPDSGSTDNAATSSKSAKANTPKTAPSEKASQPASDREALTAKITALQTQLQEADNQEAKLQQTITQLEAKLTDQSATLKDLQTQLQQSAQLQTALDQAEAAARQLANLNDTLMQENTALKAAAVEMVEAAAVTTPTAETP